MNYKTKDEIKNDLLTEKLNYIIDEYIDGGKKALALNTFGYERENTVTNLCSNSSKSTIKKIHMESIEKHHQIPMSIWMHNLPLSKVDESIKNYRTSLKEQMISFDNEDNIFKDNKEVFKKLNGVWFAYMYPSNPYSATKTEGIWIVETTINDDYSVIDYWGNAGYLKIGKNQSLIIKEPYENSDLTVIRFSNRHISFEHFHFTIVSNQNGTINEMVNFGFYSRKQYSPKQAKEILGDISKVQLKLDSSLEERLTQLRVVPY